ncbi:uncharacterized protein LOC143599263 [Bidens hawaiensis]|uniref:uncharacterized protein LOC143599263 n=1 Tax=Bidens hawaiensis TaxID=980011 RepID=UPI004049CDE6
MSRSKRSRTDSSLFSNYHHGQTSRQTSHRSTLLINASINASCYIDNGDCDKVCEFCDALFWFDERSIASSSSQQLRYTQCCKGGRVALPYPRRPYTTIINLFQQPDFMANIRAYNSVFSMTFFGAIIDDTINRGSGPYVFKISGQIHHWVGTLCPPPNERPRFLQMYVYDTENEIDNRLYHFTSGDQSRLSPQTVIILLSILESTNELVRLFRTARDLSLSDNVPDFSVRLFGSRDKCYDMPSAGCIGAIVTDADPMCTNFDIVIRYKEGGPQQFLQGVEDAVQRGDTEGRDVGKRTVLPSSFVGGPRYMYKHYQDALANCRVHGKPQYFITFTCNVKWPEITRYSSRFPSLKSSDRPDIIARVFQIKLRLFLKFIKANKIFGEIVADLYTVEFQKRGLPHCHILLWVSPSCRIKDACEIDNFISAEIPDPSAEPHLYKIVTELMIHGPCGLLNPNSPCMDSGSCSNPKHFEPETSFDDNGHVHYQRRPDRFSVVKGSVKIDNRYVVPYNCTDRIRYSISKAPTDTDRSHRPQPTEVNEIQNFVDGMFICPHEAAWRIFNFDIHVRNPAVQVLAVHLENMQNITFRETDLLENVATNTFSTRTTLTEWLSNNARDASGRHLRYIDYLSEYKWAYWVRMSNGQLPSVWATAGELRALFTQMLLFCELTDPLRMWEKQWRKMADDGLRNHGIANDDDLRQYVLYELEMLLQSATPSKSLSDYSLPMPRHDLLQQLQNRLLMEERNYDRHMLSIEHNTNRSKLNLQQSRIYEDVTSAVASHRQILVFVYGHGGTGKTFL